MNMSIQRSAVFAAEGSKLTDIHVRLAAGVLFFVTMIFPGCTCSPTALTVSETLTREEQDVISSLFVFLSKSPDVLRAKNMVLDASTYSSDWLDEHAKSLPATTGIAISKGLLQRFSLMNRRSYRITQLPVCSLNVQLANVVESEKSIAVISLSRPAIEDDKSVIFLAIEHEADDVIGYMAFFEKRDEEWQVIGLIPCGVS